MHLEFYFKHGKVHKVPAVVPMLVPVSSSTCMSPWSESVGRT